MYALLAGALTGLAVWFKYPFALFGLVPLVGYGMARTSPPSVNENEMRRGAPVCAPVGRPHRAAPTASWRGETGYSTLLAFLAFSAGGLFIVGAGIAYMASLGALDELIL